MELFTIFISALVVAFSGAIMPGPLLTVTIKDTLSGGLKSALLLIVGHSFLELILIIGFYFGLNNLLDSALLFRFIGIAGGLYLLFLSYGMIKDVLKRQIGLNLQAEQSPDTFNPVLKGLITSLSNPYWTIWWVTIGATFVAKSLRYGLLGINSFYFGHILGDFIWYGIVALILISGRRFISDYGYRIIIFICGLFLALLSLTFIFDIPLF